MRGDKNSYYLELAVPIDLPWEEDQIQAMLKASENTPRVLYAINKLTARRLSDEQIIETFKALVGFLAAEPVLVHAVVKEATGILPLIMELLEYATEPGQMIGCLLVAHLAQHVPRDLAMTCKPLKALLPSTLRLLCGAQVTLLQVMASVCLSHLSRDEALQERIGTRHLAVLIKAAKRGGPRDPLPGTPVTSNKDIHAAAFLGLYNAPNDDMMPRDQLHHMYATFYLGTLQQAVGLKRPFKILGIEEGIKVGVQCRMIHVHLPPEEYHVVASRFPKSDLLDPIRPSVMCARPPAKLQAPKSAPSGPPGLAPLRPRQHARAESMVSVKLTDGDSPTATTSQALVPVRGNRSRKVGSQDLVPEAIPEGETDAQEESLKVKQGPVPLRPRRLSSVSVDATASRRTA